MTLPTNCNPNAQPINCPPTNPTNYPPTTPANCVPSAYGIPQVVHTYTPANCVPTQAPPPCAPAPPPQYSSIYPTLDQVQQIQQYVKNQIKAESLRRAGNQGADPWGTTEAPEAAELAPGIPMPTNPLLSGLLTGTPAALPIDPAVLCQPQSLLNISRGANGAPQVVTSSTTYYAPAYANSQHREVINCCEDCCEDVCENCFLNCCLDCSKHTALPTTLLGSLLAKIGLGGNKGEYVLLQNPIPLPAGAYAATMVNGVPVDPATGLPLAVCPMHGTAGCPVNPLTGLPVSPCCPVNPLTGLPVNPLTGCPVNPLTGLPVNQLNNTIGNISTKS